MLDKKKNPKKNTVTKGNRKPLTFCLFGACIFETGTGNSPIFVILLYVLYYNDSISIVCIFINYKEKEKDKEMMINGN
jgi:hypothetical protein